MRQSETVTALFTALSKAQGEMPPATKDARNDHLRSKYATLSVIIATAQPVLARHGLGFAQMAGADEPGFMSLTTRIFHESGEWIEDTMRAAAPEVKGLSAIQAAGSVLSYMRRYALASALGMSTEDDDGQAAVASEQGKKAQQTPPRTPSPQPAAQSPTDPIGEELGQRLDAQLSTMLKGTRHEGMTHTAFASTITGREVAHLRDLTREESRKVHAAAKAEQAQVA